MSKVLSSSDSNEHSTPLSNNKGRRRGTNVPLLSSVSVLDNADNNAEASARQPSPPISPTSGQSTSVSNYTRRPSLAFQQQQQQQQDQDQGQGSQLPLTLAHHGIKVRDFAYESNLPLIPSIPRARKVVLGARPLKRTKRYFEQPDDVFTVDTHSQSQSSSTPTGLSQAFSQESDQDESVVINNKSRPPPLERKSTEPVIIPERESQRPYRDVGYADFSQHPSGSQAAQRSLRHTLTPITPTAVAFARTPTFSPVSLPFPFPATKRFPAGASQESDLSTADTPLVTPKGPLTWPSITSDVPASQLDNNSSQTPVLVQDTNTTYSPLGLFPPFSHAHDLHPDFVTVDPALGSPPPPSEVVTDLTQTPLDHLIDHLDVKARASSPPSPSPSRRARTARPLTDPTPDAGGPRYFLRKHGSPEQDRESSPSVHRRRKSSVRAPPPYPGRVPPVTRQSAHAVASDSSGRSARARPLRKTNLS